MGSQYQPTSASSNHRTQQVQPASALQSYWPQWVIQRPVTTNTQQVQPAPAQKSYWLHGNACYAHCKEVYLWLNSWACNACDVLLDVQSCPGYVIQPGFPFCMTWMIESQDTDWHFQKFPNPNLWEIPASLPASRSLQQPQHRIQKFQLRIIDAVYQISSKASYASKLFQRLGSEWIPQED